MVNTDNKRANLKILQGGLHRSISFGNLRIVAAPQESPPFDVAAMTREEDTFLIMDTDPDILPVETHPIRLMAELENFKPRPVGSVIVRKGRPIRLLAVIHDVNEDPPCREIWITRALQNIFQEVERLGLRSLGMPLLAMRHGRLPIKSFARLLGQALSEAPLASLRQLWIVAPLPENARIMELLADNLRFPDAPPPGPPVPS